MLLANAAAAPFRTVLGLNPSVVPQPRFFWEPPMTLQILFSPPSKQHSTSFKNKTFLEGDVIMVKIMLTKETQEIRKSKIKNVPRNYVAKPL